MVAKTYDPQQDFDLVEKFDEFTEELTDAGFGSIDSSTILQLISLMLRNDCKKRTILNLSRNEFIKAWPEAIENLKAAIEYVKSSLRIPVSRLLPYNSLLIPVALFLGLVDRKPPRGEQAKLITDFFWRAAWSERYSSSVDSKLAQDKRMIESFVKKKSVRFDWDSRIDEEYVLDTTFSASSAFCKTILALLASLQPRKFDSGGLVNLRNDWMRRSDSVNFHHIFPKSFLKKKGYEDWEANRILNISLVDDYLNKRVIRARSPSDYFEESYGQNNEFDETMSTHLIETRWVEGDTHASGAIWSDDYERFIDERAKSIVTLLKSKLIHSRKNA